MFKSNILVNGVFLVLLISISGCGTEPTKPQGTPDGDGQATPLSSSSSKPVNISNADKEKFRDAITALNNGDDSNSLRLFNELIRNNPNLAGPYTNLALMHYNKQEYEKSLKLTEKALKLNPDQAQAYNLRGQLNITAGKVHEAKADYLSAVKLKPNYTNAHYNLALLYDIYLQEIELAIKHYQIYTSLLKKPDPATLDWINHLKGTLSNE